jgi:ABC-2 type transport system permease protein
MSTDAATLTSLVGTARPPIGRLARVEGRKMVDTRAGRCLLALTGLIAVGMAVVAQFTATDPALVDSLRSVGGAVAVIVPILGILLVSSEWSQRTALITFALVPQRERVIGAKLIAATAVATLAGVASLIVASAAAAVASGDLGLPVGELGRAELLQLVSVAIGLSLGLALMNSALALVTYFALPSLMTLLGEFSPGIESAIGWIDPSTFPAALTEDQIAGGDWARMATAAALWIAMPAAIGLFRLRRGEVK